MNLKNGPEQLASRKLEAHERERSCPQHMEGAWNPHLQAATSSKLEAPTLVQLRAGISLQSLPVVALS